MDKHRFTPILMALSAVIGIFLGWFFTLHFSGNRLSIINAGSNKFENMLHLIDNNYVDTIDVNSLVETALPNILAELDPHSRYIPANEAQQVEDDLRGSFSGIGVSFVMQKDTVNVMSVIKGGPSERFGVMPGDRIVRADTTYLVGMRQDSVMTFLKGPRDSKVKLEIVRKGHKQPLYITVTRGDIPTHTIDADYMITDTTGYIRVKSFGENTFTEFLMALARLSSQGMTNLIVDLRGNSGGYMEPAIKMVNEFLPANSLIVYTEGRMSPRQESRSNGRGQFQQLPLVVLVDEGSASASEIFAGAIQDNDRGTIIGRRSFGKGLVQQQMAFKDGSLVRLTIARYYTPAGRCIQKPYQKGHGEDYEMDLLTRYERGEFFSQDNIKQSGPEYHTKIGRVVYGGGGIMPDLFVPEDTTLITLYYKEAVYQGLTRQFAFDYTDSYRERLSQFATASQLERFLKAQNLVEKFANYAQERGLRRRNLQIEKSTPLLERMIFANIIYNMKSDSEYYEYINHQDLTVKQAVEVLAKGESRPIKPTQKQDK